MNKQSLSLAIGRSGLLLRLKCLQKMMKMPQAGSLSSKKPKENPISDPFEIGKRCGNGTKTGVTPGFPK